MLSVIRRVLSVSKVVWSRRLALSECTLCGSRWLRRPAWCIVSMAEMAWCMHEINIHPQVITYDCSPCTDCSPADLIRYTIVKKIYSWLPRAVKPKKVAMSMASPPEGVSYVIYRFCLVILPLLPSCQSSLHFPQAVRLHSLVLCTLTHVLTKLLYFSSRSSLPSLLVFCSKDYSSKSVTSLQYLLWVQHVLPNAMKSWASSELCLFLLIGTTLERTLHPFMFLLQAIFECKWSLTNWISHFLLFPCICSNYQILTCGVFKYTTFHPDIVHVTLYGTE